MVKQLQRLLAFLLTLTLLVALLPAALAESAENEPTPDGLYDIAMTAHPEGYSADPETMTDEEWAAQFACDAYSESNAALELSQLADSEIDPVDYLKMIASIKSLPDLALKGGFWILDLLWKGLIKGEGEDVKFKAIMSKLNDIEKKLDEIKHEHKIDVYEKYLNEQLDKRTKLAVDIRLIMNDLEDVDFALNNEGGKQITKEEAAKRRKAIIMRWGTQKIAGLSSGLAATLYYINYTMQMRVRNRNYLGMLDDYIYISLPWEHQGYQARELLRSAEISTMYAALALSSMYLSLTKQMDSKTGREIAQLTADVADWFEKQKLMRDNDYAICQIRGEQGSKFKRTAVSFSEQLDPGQTIDWCVKNRQFCGMIHDYNMHPDRHTAENRRKANVTPWDAWEVILNFYGKNKEIRNIWYQDMLGRSAAGGGRFVCLWGVGWEDEYTQNNCLVTVKALQDDAKAVGDAKNCWVGFYWHDNADRYHTMSSHVKGWHKKPDSKAMLVGYRAGVLIRPDKGQEEAEDADRFTYSGPIAQVGEGCMSVLNVTNESFMYGSEQDAPIPPVLDAPEGGVVTDLFAVASAYLGRTFDISALGMEDDLKPGQWVTVTGTDNGNENGPFYRAASVEPMEIAGVEGTVTQLLDSAITFLPDDGNELALTLSDSFMLDESIDEGVKATLYYHPELVYNDDENGYCDHQQLVLDALQPTPQEDELTLTGTVDAVSDNSFAMTADDGTPYDVDITEADVNGELEQGATVNVTGRLDAAIASMTADGAVIKASAVYALAPDDELLEINGTIIETDDDLLRVFGDGGALYEFDIGSAEIIGETAEGNSVYVAYYETPLGLVAQRVVCFTPDDDDADIASAGDDADSGENTLDRDGGDAAAAE